MQQKRSFQASFLNRGNSGGGLWGSENRWEETMGKAYARQDSMTPQTIPRVRTKSPLDSSDFPHPYLPPTQEIYQTGLLGPALRPLLRSREALMQAILPMQEIQRYRRLSGNSVMAGISAIGTERRKPRSLTPGKSNGTVPIPVPNRTQTASSPHLPPPADSQARLKYFNADIIPKKQPRTVSLQELESYLRYVAVKPFK